MAQPEDEYLARLRLGDPTLGICWLRADGSFLSYPIVCEEHEDQSWTPLFVYRFGVLHYAESSIYRTRHKPSADPWRMDPALILRAYLTKHKIGMYDTYGNGTPK